MLSVRARIAVVVVVTVSTSLLVWYRLTRITPESDPARYWAAQGRKVFSPMRVEALTDPGAVRSLIEGAVIEDEEGLLSGTADGAAGLRRGVLAFIEARFGARDAQDYQARMATAGYRLKSVAEYEARNGPIDVAAAAVGVDSSEPVEILNAFWESGRSRSASPAGICADPAAVVLTVGSARENGRMRQVPTGSLGSELWHGGIGVSCLFWFQAPTTRAQVLERYRECVVARVGLIVDVLSADRRPMMLDLFYDPASSTWWIDGISVTNFDLTRGGSPCTVF